MTSQTQGGFLRQLPGAGAVGQEVPPFKLPEDREVIIGRETTCQIVLGNAFGGVSRRHATVRPLQPPPPLGVPPAWELCDLNSANGTYVNGQRLYGCHRLQAGDRILFGQPGQNCPEFVFEYQQTYQPTIPSPPAPNPYYPPTQPVSPPVANPYSPPPPGSPPGANPYPPTQPVSPPPLPVPPPPPPVYSSPGESPPSSLRFSQIFPIASTGRDLTRKGFLIPGIITVIFVVGMFATASTDRSIPQEELLNRFIIFSGLLGLYIGLGAYYFIYRLCGKFKPWWLLLGSGLLTILLFFIPVWSLFELVFRQILPGDVFGLIEGNPSVSTSVVANFFGSNIFLTLLVVFFFGAGLAEELFKALPILIAFFLGRIFNQPQRIGVSEPLDGILLGAASAVGFTLFETLLQYVPEAIQRGGAVAGLQLLIPRILGSVAGHMAYSGYFGYFIGLSVLKPRQSIQILVIGYLSASILHALWNTTSVFSLWLSALVGIVSYILLVAAILKARALSPTRSQNFATRFFN